MGARYSFNGSIQHPRQILPGGDISWTDPETLEIQQILWVDPSQPPQLRNLGRATKDSLWLHVEEHTYHLVREGRAPPTAEVRARRKAYREKLAVAAQARGKHLV